jgi:hypothetical protein
VYVHVYVCYSIEELGTNMINEEGNSSSYETGLAAAGFKVNAK